MKTQKQQGFTIIEVVLVLAIAGLIFLVVFLAVPALQRSQRDTQRRQDVGRVVSQLQQFQSNNKGDIPADQTAWTNFRTNYMVVGGDTFSDPTTGGTPYNLTVSTGNAAPVLGTIFVHTNATCGTGGDPATGAGARKVAFRIALETGGVYCQNN